MITINQSDIGLCHYLIVVDRAFVPFLSGAISYLDREYIYSSFDDYKRGYQLLQEVRLCMSGRCVESLIESVNQVYRLIDSGINGAIYSAAPDGAGGYIISPPIPPAPASAALAPAPNYNLRYEAQQLRETLRVMIAGAAPGEPLPGDSILTALRGVIPASDSRNVIDAFSGLSEEEQGELLGYLAQIALAVV